MIFPVKNIILILFVIYNTHAIADLNPVIQHKNQLKDLNTKIETLQQAIDNANDKHETLIEELAKTETQIGTLSISLSNINGKLDKLPGQIMALQEKIKHNETFIAEQQKTLAQQIRAAYTAGQHDFLKLLLQEDSPERLSRLMEYYRAIGNARSDLIKKINHKTDALAKDRDINKQEIDKLQTLKSTQTNQQQKLNNSKHYREQVIKEIHSELSNHQAELSQLKKSKHSLQDVIDKLEKVHHWGNSSKQSFQSMQGHFQFPTKGKLTRNFGERILSSNLVYNGIFIDAAEGQDVRAIHTGNVVFADWLRGFGLLIIIDHGDGYMSLYAHNESLYKHAGDSVQANELIAKVGHTGGHPRPGLYFEIRHNGIAINPEHWFKALV